MIDKNELKNAIYSGKELPEGTTFDDLEGLEGIEAYDIYNGEPNRRYVLIQRTDGEYSIKDREYAIFDIDNNKLLVVDSDLSRQKKYHWGKLSYIDDKGRFLCLNSDHSNIIIDTKDERDYYIKVYADDFKRMREDCKDVVLSVSFEDSNYRLGRQEPCILITQSGEMHRMNPNNSIISFDEEAGKYAVRNDKTGNISYYNSLTSKFSQVKDASVIHGKKPHKINEDNGIVYATGNFLDEKTYVYNMSDPNCIGVINKNLDGIDLLYFDEKDKFYITREEMGEYFNIQRENTNSIPIFVDKSEFKGKVRLEQVLMMHPEVIQVLPTEYFGSENLDRVLSAIMTGLEARRPSEAYKEKDHPNNKAYLEYVTRIKAIVDEKVNQELSIIENQVNQAYDAKEDAERELEAGKRAEEEREYREQVEEARLDRYRRKAQARKAREEKRLEEEIESVISSLK